MNVGGKVIVITGAARGLGQEYARYLGGLGARIVVDDLEDCAQTVDLVKSEGGTAVGTRLDVANSSSVQDMARATLDRFGRIDVLVNNGALKGGRFDAIPEADWGRCDGGERQGQPSCTDTAIQVALEAHPWICN
jgi:NAD(P)-dependent dehydrogenase (short-subunit alcohol dehydrogenase family)